MKPGELLFLRKTQCFKKKLRKYRGEFTVLELAEACYAEKLPRKGLWHVCHVGYTYQSFTSIYYKFAVYTQH